MEFFLFYKKYHIVHTLSSEIKANVNFSKKNAGPVMPLSLIYNLS